MMLRDEVDSALSAISPDLPYSDWARLGRAIASEFGEEGFDIFDSFSSQSNNYKAKQTRYQYSQFVGSTGVNIGSLFYMAHREGWKSPQRESISENERRRRVQESKLRQAKREVERINAKQEQENRFSSLLNTYQSLPMESGDGVYLRNKLPGIFTPHPAIKRGEDYTVYPLINKTGAITGFQKLYDNGFKQTIGGVDGVSGAFFILGQVLPGRTLYICEGIATAFTVYMATGCAVAVCLTATNIQPCSEALRTIYPHTPIIGGADNDQYTESHAGKINCEKACIDYVMPSFTAYEDQFSQKPPKDKPTDFNDLFHLSSIQAVTEQLAAPPHIVPKQPERVPVICTKPISAFQLTNKDINSQYLDKIMIEKGTTVIHSPKGTGKTTAFKRNIPEGKRVLIISNRMLLVESLAKDLDADYYKDLAIPGDHSALRTSQRLAITLNSLWKLDGSQWDMVIIDECEQVFGDLLGSTMHGRRRSIYDVLRTFLLHSEYQIFADSDVGKATRSICAQLGLKGNFINNEYQPRKDSIMDVLDSDNHLSQNFINRVNSEDLYYCSNTRKSVEKMAKNINKNLKIQVITSKGDKNKLRDFINNLDERTPELNALLCSPSAGSGMDVSHHNMVATYGSFNAETTTVQQAHQQLARVRGVDEYYVYLPPDTNNFPTDPKVIRELVLKGAIEGTGDMVGRDYINNVQKVYDEGLLDLYCEVTASKNISKNNFRSEFIAQAEREGYTINYINVDDEAAEKGKEANKLSGAEIKEQLIEDINTTPPMDGADLDKTMHTDSMAYKKGVIASLLGIEGEELNDITLMDHESSYMAKIKKLAVVSTSKEQAAKLDIRDSKNTEFVDLSYFSIRRKVFNKILSFAGINGDLQCAGTRWNDGSLKNFSQYIDRNRDKLIILGYSPPKNPYKNPAKYLNNLLASVGIKSNVVGALSNKAKSRIYQVNTESLEVSKRYAESVLKSGYFLGLPISKND